MKIEATLKPMDPMAVPLSKPLVSQKHFAWHLYLDRLYLMC